MALIQARLIFNPHDRIRPRTDRLSSTCEAVVANYGSAKDSGRLSRVESWLSTCHISIIFAGSTMTVLCCWHGENTTTRTRTRYTRDATTLSPSRQILTRQHGRMARLAKKRGIGPSTATSSSRNCMKIDEWEGCFTDPSISCHETHTAFQMEPSNKHISYPESDVL